MNDTTKKSSALFLPSGCLTGDALMLFVSGSLKDTDLTRTQQHVAECPLCEEAADGLRMWLKEQNEISGDKEAGTSELSEKSFLTGEKTTKHSSSPAYKFHSRTDKINERVRQRLNFHKQVESIKHKRRPAKPYAWLAAAAVVVLFIGIFYVVRFQSLFEQQQLAKNEQDVLESPVPNASEYIGLIADSTSAGTNALALKKDRKKGENKADLNTLAVVSDDAEVESENVEIASSAKPPESIPVVAPHSGEASPAEVSDVVITRYEVTRAKKSKSAVNQEVAKESVSAGADRNKAQGKAQQLGVVEDAKEVFLVVEQMPEFPGGDAARVKFLSENIQYPLQAVESGIQGTVYVSFIVDIDGRLDSIKILRGIGGGCDEEALRVVKNMPKWKPGLQGGKLVTDYV